MKMRGIKPDFWTDENVVEVSPFARLLFVGLWQMACDNGHVKDSPKRIKMSILPADDVRIEVLIDELAGADLVIREDGWIEIPNLSKHQRIDPRYFLACEREGCIKPGKPSGQGAEDGHIPAQDTQGTRSDHAVHPAGPRDEGEGEGENNSLTGVGATNAAPKSKRGCRLDPAFIPSEESRARILADFPTLDIRREHAKFVDYWTDQAGAKGVRISWDGTWRNWMRKAADDLTRNGSGGKSRRQQETDDLFARASVRLGVTNNEMTIEGETA